MENNNYQTVAHLDKKVEIASELVVTATTT